MKKFIMMGLLLSTSAIIMPMEEKIKKFTAPTKSTNTINWCIQSSLKPNSLHNHEHFVGLAQGIAAIYPEFKKASKTDHEICPLNCKSDALNGAKCTSKTHTKRALKLHSLQLLDGLKLGIQNYLILHHLYQQGAVNASTQVGINLLVNESLKYLVKEKKKTVPGKKMLRMAGGSAVKYGIKYGLYNYLNMPSSVVYEPHKMISFVKGSMINSGTNLTDYSIAKSGNYLLKKYPKIANDTYYDVLPILSRGVGVAVGALIASYFLEEKLDDLAKFASEQIKDHGPEFISKIVSLTK